MPTPKGGQATTDRGRDAEREAFLQAHLHKSMLTLSPAAIADLRYFRKQFDETGRVLSRSALQRWMQEKHGLTVGRWTLHTLATKAGIKPWWSK